VTDLQIRVFAPRDGVCRVEARLNDSTRFDGEATFDVSGFIGETDPLAYGRRLRDALFASAPLQRAYIKASAGAALRLRLLVDAPEVSELRWERLMLEVGGEEAPAAATPRTPFSRYQEQEQSAVSSTDVPRILLAIANPSDLQRLSAIDVDGEVDNLLDAWGDLLADGSLHLAIIPGRSGLSAENIERIRALRPACRFVEGPATLERVSRELRDASGLHVVAHGTLDAERRAVLVLETEAGTTALIEEDALCVALQHPGLRLAFLQSCKSTAGNLLGLGPKLVQFGVPAVLAMQDFMPMADARRFAGSFYRTLVREGAADVAANAGRQEIYRSKSANWSIPVLFCRLRDGQIWTPDPVRNALRKLARHHGDDPTVQHPFPLDGVLVRGGLAALRQGTEHAGGARLPLMAASLQALGESSRPFVVLLSHRGRAKSTHLRGLFVETWRRAQDAGGPTPLFIRLDDCRATHRAPVETIARAAGRVLEESDIPPDGLGAALRDALVRQPFRLLVDGDDDLGASARFEALRALMEFQREAGPAHEIFVTTDESTFDPAHYPDRTVALVIQPMLPERVGAYVERWCPDVAGTLLPRLRETALFDLASVPWVLTRLIENSRHGVAITSRAAMLERFVRDGLALLGGPAGTRSRAGEALTQMAWRLQLSRRASLPAAETYGILADVRGHRDFPLEGFLDEILESRLLVKTGDEGVRFAYPGLQSYYSARFLAGADERTQALHLEDITATLGRLARVRWWHDTLVVLAGLADEADPLLRMILAGSRLSEGEQVFVAARCLHEARQAGRSRAAADVVDQIVDALVWRSRPESGGATSARRMALEALALLREPRTIPHLVSLAIHPVRRNWEGKLTYDYSGVRQAAVQALFAMQDETLGHVRGDPDLSQHPAVQRLIAAWLARDAKTLGTLLASEDPRVASVSAFALGTFRTDEGLDLLVARYRALATAPHQGDVLWAITDTLSVLDPVQVTERAIRPLLAEPNLAPYLAYLIGRLGIATAGGAEIEFLRRSLQSDNGTLQGRALRSYAALLAAQGAAAPAVDVEALRDVCHGLVLDDFTAAAAPALIHVPSGDRAEARWQLRYQALEALRSIGDQGSLDVLRAARRRSESRSAPVEAPDPRTRPGGEPGGDLLPRQSFEIAEEIYWRLTGGLSAETYRPLDGDGRRGAPAR
jgi:HEAT repeat protein